MRNFFKGSDSDLKYDVSTIIGMGLSEQDISSSDGLDQGKRLESIQEFVEISRDDIYDFFKAIGQFVQDQINLEANLKLLETLFETIIRKYESICKNQMNLLKRLKQA